MIIADNLQRLLITLLLIAGFISAIISDVKLPTLVMLFLLFVYLTNYKINRRYYIVAVFFLLMSVVISIFNSFDTLFYAVYLIMFTLLYYVGVSAFNVDLFLQDSWMISSINFFTICLFAFVFMAFILGLDANTLLPTGSRNSLGILVLAMGSLSYLLSKKFRYVFLMGIIFILLLLGGRTNWLAAFLIGIYIVAVLMDSKALNVFFCGLAFLSLVVIEKVLGLDTFFNLLFYNEAGTSIGLRSSRTVVWEEWSENITLVKFIFGFSLSELPFVIWKLNGNPHNSYILIHSYTGILSIFFFCWLIYKWLTISWRVSFFIGLLLVKGFFDTVLMPSSLDVFLLFFLFIGHYEKVRNI